MAVLVVALGMAYAAYRLSLTIAAVRADRAGDAARGEHLRKRAGRTFIGITGTLTLALLIVAAIAVAKR